MNRYDDISVAKFNPLSMQEVMMVPMIKRKQHDDLIAQQELIKQGLAKVDPLDKHYGEALRLKNELESKIDGYANKLAKEGVNTQMTGEMIALNRDYQNKIGPMGAIGQINAAKKAYEEESANYLKQATAMKYSPETVQKHLSQIQSKYNQDPIYDKNGKVTALKIDELPPNYLNHLEEARSYFKEMGIDEKEWSNATAGIVFDPKLGQYVASQTHGGSRTTNAPQQQFVLNFMNNRIGNQNGDLRKSLDYQGIDPNQAIQDIQDMSGIYRKRGEGNKQTYDISNYSGPTKSEEVAGGGTAISEAVEMQDVVGEALEKLNLYTNGLQVKPVAGSPMMMGTDGGQEIKNGTKNMTMEQRATHFKNTLTPEQQRMYSDTFNAKVAQGKIKKGTNMYSEEATKVIQDTWKTRSNLSFSNNVEIPGSSTSYLASPTMDRTEAKDRDAFVVNRIALARKNGQQVLYDEKGKPISLDNVKGNIRLVGHYNPANILPAFGGNPDNTISPHVIEYMGTDDKLHTAIMPRDVNEIKTNPYFRAARVINKTVNKASTNAGDFTGFSQKDYPELKNADLTPLGIPTRGTEGIRVKYNPDDGMFTLEILKDGKSQKTTPLTNQQYQNLMYDIIE